MSLTHFDAPPVDKAALEEGSAFTPKFDSNGLLTAVVTGADSKDVLMVAHMNAEALALTLESGIAHYWSRSRKSLWKKGETSGNFQRVTEIRTDCDQDAIVLKVEVEGDGKTCHTGRVSCFYRTVHLSDGSIILKADADSGHSHR